MATANREKAAIDTICTSPAYHKAPGGGSGARGTKLAARAADLTLAAPEKMISQSPAIS
jgi:hypothetical protein